MIKYSSTQRYYAQYKTYFFVLFLKKQKLMNKRKKCLCTACIYNNDRLDIIRNKSKTHYRCICDTRIKQKILDFLISFVLINLEVCQSQQLKADTFYFHFVVVSVLYRF